MITSTELLTDSFVQTCFWDNCVSCEFPKPMCFVGQIVLHHVGNIAEMMIPVKVIGFRWTGIDWEFDVKLPEEHPEYSLDDEDENCVYDVITLNEWQIILIN